MRKPSVLIFTAMAAAIATVTASTAAHAANFYVSATTTNTTRSGSYFYPFKTLAEVNAAQADGRINAGDSVLFICGGVWRTVQTPLRLKTGVTYKPNGTCTTRPALTGGVTLKGLTWAPVTPGSKIYVAAVPATVSLDGVDVPITNITQLIDATSSSPSKRLQRARHPNAGEGAFNGVAGTTNSRFFRMGPNTPQATVDRPLTQVLHLNRAEWSSKSAINAEADYLGATVVARTVEWRSARYLIEGVDNTADVDKVTLRLEDPVRMIADPIYPKDRAFERRGYWLENKLWMLDKAGEWYYEPSTRKLYVWRENGSTPSTSTTYEAVVGQYGMTAGMLVQQGVAIQYSQADTDRADNFTVTGLEVRDVAMDAISIMGNASESGSQTAAFNLNNLVIRRAGRNGIVAREVKGSRDSTRIQNVVLEDVSGDAIDVAGGAEPVLTRAGNFVLDTNTATNTQSYRFSWLDASRNITIDRNTISRAGVDGMMGYAAISAVGPGHAITGNTLNTVGSRAIEFGQDALVSRNVITRACEVQNDCGAIYTVTWHVGTTPESPEANPFNAEISNNVVTDTLGTGDGTFQGLHHDGIYLDDLARAIVVKNNHIANARLWGIFLHGARDVVVDQNTIVASQANSGGLGIGNSGISLALTDALRNTISNNLIVATGQDAVTVEHGRALPPQGDEAGGPMTRGVAKYFRNHYVTTSGEPFRASYPDPGQQFGDRVFRPILRQRLSFLAWINQEGSTTVEDSFAEDGGHLGGGHVNTTRLTGVYSNLPIDRIQGLVTDPTRPWASSANLLLPLGGHFDTPDVLQNLGWYALNGSATLASVSADPFNANCFSVNGCLGITPVPVIENGQEVKSWFNERRLGTPTTQAMPIAVKANPGDQFLLTFLARSVYRDAQGQLDRSEKGDAVRPEVISASTYQRLVAEQPYFAVGSTLKSYRVPLTVLPDVPANSDIRIDLWTFSNAQVQLDELELYKVVREPSPTDRVFIDVNTSAAARPVKCSLPAGKVAADFRDLADLSKPLVCSGSGAQRVPAYGSRVFVWSPATAEGRKHQDIDGDQVPDGVDLEIYDNAPDQARVNGINFMPPN